MIFIRRVLSLRMRGAIRGLHTMEARDYAAAVAALNTLQSNFSIVDKMRKTGTSLNQQAIPEMLDFLKRVGYEPKDLNRFNPIHIAGTKGKGSTSAMISSILTQYRPSPTTKVGLYTSPHLRFVRERIQIDNEPISEDMFAKYFFDIWDRLEASGDSSKPVYFRYLTLMAYHAFLTEGVDSAVIECGIGGEFDSTNLFEKPTVTAITSLGIDHVYMLGGTLPEIAWHKAGVFKPGVPAFTAPQPKEALDVLSDRAKERETNLTVVQRHPQIESGEVKLGLAADFQKTNASVAVAAAAAQLRALGQSNIPDHETLFKEPLPHRFRRGLEDAKWPGRCDVRKDPRNRGLTWCLDGGHTLESLDLTARWFAKEVCPTTWTPGGYPSRFGTPRILIFNQQTRDAPALIRAFYATMKQATNNDKSPFTHAIFTTNVTYKDGGYKPDLVSLNYNTSDVSALKVQNELADVWRGMNETGGADQYTRDRVYVMGTIQEAIEHAREIVREYMMVDRADHEGYQSFVLVTGSLHLVGGALEILENS